MYNYNLIISILSEDENLERVIGEIDSLPGFTHSISRYNEFNDKILIKSDIVICDLPNINVNDIIKKVNKDSKVIVCSDNYKSEYSATDGIIYKPLGFDYIKNNLKNILEKIKLERDLDYTQTCLTTAFDSIPDMMWIKSIDGIHTFVNREFCEVVDKDYCDVIGHDHYQIWDVSPDDPKSGADMCKKTEDEVISAGHTLQFTEYVKSKSGMKRLITYKSPLADKNGKTIGTIGIGQDVTKINNLFIENETLLNSMPDAVLIRDINGNIRNVNSNFERYFGVYKSDVIGTTYDDWSKLTFKPGRTLNNEGFLEGITYEINGEEKQFELRSGNICDTFGDMTGQLCVFRNVTSERKLEAEIIESSNIDFLTKLYNRKYLYEFISKQKLGIQLNLFSIDLDHFKDINDTYGHKVGDDALKLTSDVILECFPRDLTIRMGGDEFLVVKIGNYSEEQVEFEAQRLLESFKNEFEASSVFDILSASVGISQGKYNGGNFENLLQYSDNALYNAKESGRSCHRVYKKIK